MRKGAEMLSDDDVRLLRSLLDERARCLEVWRRQGHTTRVINGLLRRYELSFGAIARKMEISRGCVFDIWSYRRRWRVRGA